MRKSVLFLLAVLVFVVLLVVMLSTPNGPVDADAPRAGAPSAIQSFSSSLDLLLFGGELIFPEESSLGDTWHYDGVDWNPVPTNGSAPSPRSRCELVYDSKRNRSVLFGGEYRPADPMMFFNDTWAYASGVWTQLHPPTSPSPRAYFDMAYDSNRDVVVLFGGYDGPWGYCAHSALTDTWEFDGSTWQQIPTAHSPPQFIGGAMAYDEAGGKVVLLSGWECQGFDWRNQTWEYDGIDWIQTTSGILGDELRYNSSMAYDPNRQRVVLFGGNFATPGFDDTWEYDGIEWVEISTTTTPPGRQGHSMVYHPDRGKVIMFGGRTDAGLAADLWEYDGTSWQQVSTASEPPGRRYAAVAPAAPTSAPCGPDSWTHVVGHPEAGPTFPFWSDDGAQILYTLWFGLHKEIWAVNADGTDAHPIIDDEPTTQWGELSPNGQKLVYVRYQGENAHKIVVADADGSNRNEIVSSDNNIHPRWSPDGSVILFSRGPVNTSQLYTIRPDGSDMQQITSLGCEIRQASWSPDGTEIVFAWNGDYACDRDRWDIYAIDADGSNLRKLTSDGEAGVAHNGWPEWSPDGRWIAYHSNRGDGSSRHLWIMESDGSTQRQLTTGSLGERYPSWSPDGRYVAFCAQADTDATIYRLDVEECRGLPGAPGEKLYVIGGNDSTGALSLVEVYDPATDSWSTASPMPAPKYTASAVVIDRYIYVLGADNRLFRYHPATDSWGELASIPTADVHQLWKATGVVDGKIYASSGHSWMYMYDPASDSWSPRTAVPWERSIEGFASLNGRLYAIGGGEPGHVPGEIDRVDLYDPATDSWTYGGAATMPGQRTHLPGVIPLLDGKIYVAGGWNGNSAQSTVFVYDPATDEWASEANMPTARWRLACGVSGGQLYAMGGNYGGAGGNWQDLNEELTPGGLPPRAVWASRAPMPTARDGMAIAVVPEMPVNITRIEINQAIQDETNSVPLVADKRTVFRMYVRAAGHKPVQNVTGQLHILQDGSPIHTASPQPRVIEARPAAMPYADTEILTGRDALNFYLDGLPAGTYTFSATVGISPSVDDSASRVATGEFTSTLPIRILYCNVKQDSALPNQDSLTGYYDDYFNRVYPIPRSDSIEREYEYEGSIENLASCPMSEDHCQMALVADLWARLWWHNATSEPNADFAVGFVPPGTLGAAGVAIPIIPTVIVEHDASHSGSTLAHEIAHYQDFDLGDEYAGGKFNCEINPPASHVTSTHPPNSCPDSTQLGDESGTFINAQQNRGAFDVYEGSAKWVPDLPFAPLDRSFMGIGTNANSWVTENVYRRLVKVLSAGPEMVEQQALAPTRYVLLSGIISQADEADLEPFYVYSDTTAPDAPLPGPYSAQVQDTGGSPLATQPFTVSFALLGSQVEDADAAPFLFAMPYPEGSRRVVLKHGSTVLANVAASDNPPTVTVTSPAGGESWSGVHGVQWAAGDLDGDPLEYTLLYTSDGTDWLALATNVTETTYALDTSTVAGGAECRVEVWASDGINTSTARSNPFSVVGKAPHATIISPPSGPEVHPTEALVLNGVGYDFEDGQLSGAALTWICDAVGALGNGSPLFVDWLPVGTHAITLTATDSELMTGTATITLTMLNEVPSLGAVVPLSGTGEVSVTTFFTTTWTDPNGWQDLKQCWFHIGGSPALAGNVTLLYNTVKDKLWLRSHDGTVWTGGFAPSSANVLENSQAIVHCDQTTVQGSDDTLSVTWAIEFKPGFEGAKKLGLKCKDRSKAKAKGEWKGTWTIE